jgi:hypothetical protein
VFRQHSLLAALVTTTIMVTVALGWAGWRLLDQQRRSMNSACETSSNGAPTPSRPTFAAGWLKQATV